MKYTKIILNFNHGGYRLWGTDKLNGYTKNEVTYSLGEFQIYVDSDKIEIGKAKILKFAESKYQKMINLVK